jgi:cytochrome c biogenesis protein CcmG/thiol:disulfide interchange protein DsbE
MRPRIRLLLAGLATAALLAGCTTSGDGSDGPARTDDVTAVDTVLQPCPEQPDEEAADGDALPAVAFDCLGGGELDLARAPGVPTVVNLWASWCGPCREELPLMQEVADAAGDRLHVVGVISRDGVPQAASFAEDAGISFPGAFDRDGALMAHLGLNGLPFTFFLDADGALVHSEVGQISSAEELRGLVAEYLGVQL